MASYGFYVDIIYLRYLWPVLFGKKAIVTSGPDIALFKTFREKWNNIEPIEYLDFSSDVDVYNALKDIASERIFFCKRETWELLQLTFFLFHDQLKLRKKDAKLIAEISVFIGCCYVKAWFSAANTTEAPLNDIHFLRN